MKLKFLGSGSALVRYKENFQSSILIIQEAEEHVKISKETYSINRTPKGLIYDFGDTIWEALDYHDIPIEMIDSIFISHLHGDHAGGIEKIAFGTYFSTFPFGQNKINLYGHVDVLEEGWEHTWMGGLRSIQGQVNQLSTYFNTHYLHDNDSFDFYGVKIYPLQTTHVVDDRRTIPSYGLIIRGKEEILITGDTQFAPNQLLTFYAKADVIFNDCEIAEYDNSVHAQFHQLAELPGGIKNKMWLYHYTLKDRTYEELEQMVLDSGFAGLVKRGQEFEF